MFLWNYKTPNRARSPLIPATYGEGLPLRLRGFTPATTGFYPCDYGVDRRDYRGGGSKLDRPAGTDLGPCLYAAPESEEGGFVTTTASVDRISHHDRRRGQGSVG